MKPNRSYVLSKDRHFNASLQDAIIVFYSVVCTVNTGGRTRPMYGDVVNRERVDHDREYNNFPDVRRKNGVGRVSYYNRRCWKTKVTEYKLVCMIQKKALTSKCKIA